MNMTGFERLIRTLRGLAMAYGIYIIIDHDGVYLYYSEDPRHHKKVPNYDEAIENEIAFEEFIKDFIKEVKDDSSINSKCSDLPKMQSGNA